MPKPLNFLSLIVNCLLGPWWQLKVELLLPLMARLCWSMWSQLFWSKKRMGYLPRSWPMEILMILWISLLSACQKEMSLFIHWMMALRTTFCQPQEHVAIMQDLCQLLPSKWQPHWGLDCCHKEKFWQLQDQPSRIGSHWEDGCPFLSYPCSSS